MTTPHKIIYTCVVCGRRHPKPKRTDIPLPYRTITRGQQTVYVCNWHFGKELEDALNGIPGFKRARDLK